MLGRRFRQLRERSGLSVAQFAEMAGINPASVHDLEAHDDELPSVYALGTIELFCAALQVQVADLFELPPPHEQTTPAQFAAEVAEFCARRGQSVAEFTLHRGWKIPEEAHLAQYLWFDLPLDGLIDLCDGMNVGWRKLVS